MAGRGIVRSLGAVVDNGQSKPSMRSVPDPKLWLVPEDKRSSSANGSTVTTISGGGTAWEALWPPCANISGNVSISTLVTEALWISGGVVAIFKGETVGLARSMG